MEIGPEGAGRPGAKGQESSRMLWSLSFSHFFVATCLMQVTTISTWIAAVAWPPHIYYDPIQSQLHSVARIISLKLILIQVTPCLKSAITHSLYLVSSSLPVQPLIIPLSSSLSTPSSYCPYLIAFLVMCPPGLHYSAALSAHFFREEISRFPWNIPS